MKKFLVAIGRAAVCSRSGIHRLYIGKNDSKTAGCAGVGAG